MARPSIRDDRGETLVELMVTLVILGTAVLALVGGIGTAITISDVHRKQSNAGAYVRDYADGIENYIATGSGTVTTGYKPCSSSLPVVPTSTYQTPPGYTFTDPTHYNYTVTGTIAYWDTSLSTPAWRTSNCPSNGDSGVQRVSLRVASADGRASESLDIIIRRPCRSTENPPC